MPDNSQEKEDVIAHVISMLRTSQAYTVMMSQAAAERIGINTTDLHSLNLIAFSERDLSAGDLARLTGLTTASITTVIDRLERAGLVKRTADPGDRRRVVLKLIPEATRQRVAPVFASLLTAWRDELSKYSLEELRLIFGFQQRALDIMLEQVTLLRHLQSRAGRVSAATIASA
jgi:DNA-binding MarR family transcriptional regulator